MPNHPLVCNFDKFIFMMYYLDYSDKSEIANNAERMVSMAKRAGVERCCLPEDGSIGSCKVESMISVDERGQMVLPKETREKANIQAGDKLALVSWEKEGKICCMFLIKAEELGSMVKSMLGPIVKEILK